MSRLQAFMSANVAKVETARGVISTRITDGEGKPVEWELRGITTAEDMQIRKESVKKIFKNGRAVDTDVDYDLYLSKLAACCVTFPDLHNAELQNSYGVMGADALLCTMLTPGEYAELIFEIQKLNGFDQSMDDLVEEAKN